METEPSQIAIPQTLPTGNRNPEKSAAPRLDGVRVLAVFGGTKLFGQERANIEVFRNLAAMGAEVRVVTTSRGGENEVHRELTQHGIDWITAPFGYTWHRYLLGRHFYYWFINIYGILAVSWRVWREIRRWYPSHLYCMNFQYFIYAWPALALTNLPLVWRAGDELPMHSRLHRWTSALLLMRVNVLVCISDFLKERLVNAGRRAQGIRIIYNHPPKRGCISPLLAPERPPNARVITFVGQVSENKGILVLFQAIEQLVQAGKNVALWVAGAAYWNAELTEQLKKRAQVEGIDGRIKLFGFVENVKVLLEKSDIHVCPSLFAEPSGNVVLEAKLAGKPSVVFPRGGLPELIEHKVDGYICRDCSVEALVEGINHYLERPDECLLAGEAARRSLEQKYGLDRFRRQWAEVFRDTVCESGQIENL